MCIAARPSEASQSRIMKQRQASARVTLRRATETPRRPPSPVPCTRTHAFVQVIVEHKAVQAHLDGAVALADLLAAAEGAADAPERQPSVPQEPMSRTASHLRLLRGAARLVGLNAMARRHALEAQLTRLEELRQGVVRKMNSKAVKDSLRELRKYRRPPRAAAQVRCAALLAL